MRAAAWEMMEPMSATFRRHLLLSLGRCCILTPSTRRCLSGGTENPKQNAQKRQRDSDDGSSSIIRESPGAKFCRCITSEGMLVLDDDRFDLVLRRTASADVDKILMATRWVVKLRG